MKQGNPRLHSINVKVADPNGNNVPTTVEWDDQPEATGLGTFIPTVVGEHQVRCLFVYILVCVPLPLYECVFVPVQSE